MDKWLSFEEDPIDIEFEVEVVVAGTGSEGPEDTEILIPDTAVILGHFFFFN